MSFDLVVRLVEAVGETAAGSSVHVPVGDSADVEVVRAWCDATGNTVLAVHMDTVEIHRGPIVDPVAALASGMRPGYRLWVYTNFHCNLACDYCCVSSSPAADRRIIGVGEFAELVDEAVDAGFRELFLTGGEPFLLVDLDERVRHAAKRLPTTVLTNAMVFTGTRRRRLEALPRENVTLQVSLDSAGPDLHDRHRGHGSHARALDGLRLALGLGFRVRVAATLGADCGPEEEKLTALFDELGLGPDQRVVRRVAAQGVANAGLVVSRASLLPELCVTAEGVWWHPVAATDPEMKVADVWRPLTDRVRDVTEELRKHRIRGEVLASTFPCA